MQQPSFSPCENYVDISTRQSRAAAPTVLRERGPPRLSFRKTNSACELYESSRKVSVPPLYRVSRGRCAFLLATFSQPSKPTAAQPHRPVRPAHDRIDGYCPTYIRYYSIIEYPRDTREILFPRCDGVAERFVLTYSSRIYLDPSAWIELLLRDISRFTIRVLTMRLSRRGGARRTPHRIVSSPRFPKPETFPTFGS